MMSMQFSHAMPFGAQLVAEGVRFRFYAPAASTAALVFETDASSRIERTRTLRVAGGGWFEATVAEAGPGTRYAFVLDGAETRVPDPASRYQPSGVHGPSVVVDPHAFAWPADGWTGLPWNEHVFYELHLGTFTPEGTYLAAIEKFDHLAELGITAIELLPVAEIPGARNWGYDGVLPYAPTRNYGTPDDLKTLVAAAHARGIAVFLDVVYNHFGPEGNYLHGYAPTFYTERHQTPWGAAIDVESDDRRDVRAFFYENALYWLDEFRFDGLRFDAVHAIYDGADRLFLKELAAIVHERAHPGVHLVLENANNEAELLEDGRYDAQWDDDEHHALHVIATGEGDGYYADYFSRPVARLGRTLTQGFGYQGEYSEHEGANRGTPSAHLRARSFVTFLQNHDQIGNRPFGDRITAIASPEAVRAMAAIYLLAPSPPMLFMGEEWGASSPFLFFCDFEPELAKLVTEGRRNEFKAFGAFADPASRDRIPDPGARSTFEKSRLAWGEIAHPDHAAWLAYYRDLIAIRKREIAPVVRHLRGSDAAFETPGERGLRATWRLDDGATLHLTANLAATVHPDLARAPGREIFTTGNDPLRPDTAPPWTVRWSIA